MKRSILLLLTALALLTGCQATPPVSSAAPQYPPYLSQRDSDGDGIDDQTDILESARSYLATRPKYKSKYYAGGYPDDGYGVCTDVVIQALLGAGIDLKSLLDTDVSVHPDAYGISQPDPNIDFRRVVNQNIYFQRHAISLTRDLSQVEQWQGGDIVVFHNHVGIVSDRRRADGLPYLLHHYSRFQLRYEQDALEDWGDAVGHYRVSE